MTGYPSADNKDPSLYCKYFGGPRDGFKSGDLPASFSGRKLTGMGMKIPLAQPADFSIFAVYQCLSETQVNGFWEFYFQGYEGPHGERLVAAEELPGEGAHPRYNYYPRAESANAEGGQ
jgi:hypothetical protein